MSDVLAFSFSVFSIIVVSSMIFPLISLDKVLLVSFFSSLLLIESDSIVLISSFSIKFVLSFSATSVLVSSIVTAITRLKTEFTNNITSIIIVAIFSSLQYLDF